jgi:hypothetical protein
MASGGGENEMKKRIIFFGLYFVLLMIFTSLSYAGYDARAIPVKEHPDQELLSTANPFGFNDIILVVMPGGTPAQLLVHLRSSTSEEKPVHKIAGKRGVRCEANGIERVR